NLYVENVKDTYHASVLHTFFTTFRISRLTTAGGVAIAESGAHHASYTYGEQRGDNATSDQLYSEIHSLHEDYRLKDPRFLDSVDEIGGHGHAPQPTRATEASVRGFWNAWRPLMGL